MANRAKVISSEIGCRIRELRQQFGYTQKDLADRLYKSESAIRMWELCKSEPDLQAINLIADIFGISTDYLLGNKTNNEEKTSNDKIAKIALFGCPENVTEDMWNKVLDYVNLLKLEQENKSTKKD